MTSNPAILAQIRALPPLPAAAVDVLTLLRDPEVDAGAVARAISYDPGLTANLLRMANSTAWGGRQEIGSIEQALIRLGTRSVMSLVVCSAVGPIAQGPVDGYELDSGKLWEHCVSVAVATQEFAAVLGIRPPMAAFTAGMLCDIGKLALGTLVGGAAAEIRHLAFEERLSFECAERQLLGCDHAEAGATLLQSWQLPDDVVAAVRWHHDPGRCPEPARPVADLVHVADYACTQAGLGGGQDGTNYGFSAEAAARTGLGPEQMEAAMCYTVCKLEELRESFALATRDR